MVLANKRDLDSKRDVRFLDLGSARLGSARLGSARLASARLGSARLGSARLGSARPSKKSLDPKLAGSGPRGSKRPPHGSRLPDEANGQDGRTRNGPTGMPTHQHLISPHFISTPPNNICSQNSQMERRYHILRVGNPSDKKKAISVGNVWRPEWNFEPRGCNQPAQEIPRNIPECSEVWRRF